MKGRIYIHGPLFVLALVAALAIKMVVHESLQLSETTVEALVRYSLPKQLVILETVNTVKVRLRAPRSEISALNPYSVEVQVAIGSDDVGRVEITAERLQVRTPGDFEIISIEPNRFVLEIESVERATLRVRVLLAGEPAAGATAGEPTVEPDRVEVAGPRSRIQILNDLVVTVHLDRHAITFDETVRLLAPDPLVHIVGPADVRVHVPMQIPGLEAPDAAGSNGGAPGS